MSTDGIPIRFVEDFQKDQKKDPERQGIVSVH